MKPQSRANPVKSMEMDDGATRGVGCCHCQSAQAEFRLCALISSLALIREDWRFVSPVGGASYRNASMRFTL